MFDRFKNNHNFKMPKSLAIFFADYFSFFLLLIFILLLFFSYTLAIKPKYDEIIKQKVAFKAEEEGVQSDIRKEISQYQKYLKDYKLLSLTGKSKVFEMIPLKPEVSLLFPWMEKLIEGEMIDGILYGGGYFLDSIEISILGEDDDNPKSKTKVKLTKEDQDIYANIGVIEINLQVSGVNYDTLKSLLEKLENNVRLMDVQNMTFSGDSVDLLIHTYYFKDQELLVKNFKGGVEFNTNLFKSTKFKDLTRTELIMADLNTLDKGNDYPFGKKENIEE